MTILIKNKKMFIGNTHSKFQRTEILKGLLTCCKAQIVSPDGEPVRLRGVNFGGWLMREAYFLHSPNLPEKFFRSDFTKALGEKAWEEWDTAFNNHFIRASDFRQVAQWGFNSIRLPFHHRVIETKPYHYDRKGVDLLKKAVRQAKTNGLYVILDLHGAPGGQNHDWHSDSCGRAELWTSKKNQQRVFALWEFLANEFKDESTVAGYDLLNESVIGDVKVLNAFYKTLIKRIRGVDHNHLLFVEPNIWATQVHGLEDIFDQPQTVLSIHSYEPLAVTFNFVPFLGYPANGYDKAMIRRHHDQYARFAKKHSVPVHVGEFGVNFRKNTCGEVDWLKDMLQCFREFDFHWNYWTYKAVKNSAFPDGILSYYPNPPWVHRPGPKMGWETYHLHWPTRKREMMQSWRTEEFTLNKPILDGLRHALKNHKSR